MSLLSSFAMQSLKQPPPPLMAKLLEDFKKKLFYYCLKRTSIISPSLNALVVLPWRVINGRKARSLVKCLINDQTAVVNFPILDMVWLNRALIQSVYYLKDEAFFLTMPLQLVLQRDSWLLLFVVQTSTWLSSSSHVTEKIYCNIFKYRFCTALVLRLCRRELQATFDNTFILRFWSLQIRMG